MANELRKDALTFWGLVFFAVTVIFPAGPFAVTGVTAMFYSGEVAPLAFLIGGLSLFLAVIAVYVFATHTYNAGGYYKYVEVSTGNRYLSKSVGFYYLFWVIGDMIAASMVVAWLLWAALGSFSGYNLPIVAAVLVSLVTPVIYLFVGYYSITVSQKSAIIMGLFEILFFVGLSIAILVRSPYNGVQYFNISNSLDGLHGFFLAMVVGAFLAYGGYGAIVTLGEEARMPLKTLRKAIVVALAIMVAYDTFVVYANVAGLGPNLGTGMQFFAPGLYMTQAYYGTALAVDAFVVVEVSQLMSPVLFGNSGSRALFALARDGVFPSVLTKIHPKHKTPYISVIVVFITVVAGILLTLLPMVYLFGVGDGLFDAFVIWAIAITVFTLIYHVIVNQALILLTKKLGITKILTHFVAPTIASVLMVVAIYYSLLGLTWPLSIAYYMIPAWIVIAVAVTFVRRNKLKMDRIEDTRA